MAMASSWGLSDLCTLQKTAHPQGTNKQSVITKTSSIRAADPGTAEPYTWDINIVSLKMGISKQLLLWYCARSGTREFVTKSAAAPRIKRAN
jgi:hypothetical protein